MFSILLNKKLKKKMNLSSPDILPDHLIDKVFTCSDGHGQNKNPRLEWNPSKGVRSYVVIVDDPDAKHVVGTTVTH